MNIVWHSTKVTKSQRNELNKHKSVCLWFTGLSGSGKSTLANAVEDALHQRECHTYLLDGDNVRHGLNDNLDFSEGDRKENIRRIGEVAKLFVDAGIIILAALISPFQNDRDSVRKRMEPGEFVEIHVDCDLETCESRDPKGLYKKARTGEIQGFTGISSPYESPENPEIKLFNGKGSDLQENVEKVLAFLEEKGII